MELTKWPALIGGAWVSSLTGDWFEVRNPADNREVVGLAPEMSDEDVSLCAEAVADGAAVWSHTAILTRAAVLAKAGSLLRERVELIARTVTLEMGKTLRESRPEVMKAADFFEYYAGLARWPLGSVVADNRPNTQVVIKREPVGRVLAIAPWNDPVITPARKLAPALISGNSVVLKPAPESPLSALLLARALYDAGLPAGVLNVITGSTDRIGHSLVVSDSYDALSFTGSTAVGLALKQLVASKPVRFEAEMGGKNCAVVTEHADLDLAADALIAGAYVQAGQRCTATSRLLATEQIYDAVIEAVAKRIATLRVGPGVDDDTDVGPMISAARRDAVAGILTASNSGGEVSAGGAAYDSPSHEYGGYLSPTLIRDVPADSTIWRDELFAPVLAARSVDTLENAISEVNSSQYGLSAAIFTDSLTEASLFADEVNVGCVAVNQPTAGWDAHVPFGGIKASGNGQQEQGTVGLDVYTHWKSIAVRTRP